MGLSGHRKGFSRILGSSEQSVKMSLPLGVGGGGGRKEQCMLLFGLYTFHNNKEMHFFRFA